MNKYKRQPRSSSGNMRTDNSSVVQSSHQNNNADDDSDYVFNNCFLNACLYLCILGGVGDVDEHDGEEERQVRDDNTSRDRYESSSPMSIYGFQNHNQEEDRRDDVIFNDNSKSNTSTPSYYLRKTNQNQEGDFPFNNLDYNYAAKHELLMNSLFKDTKQRYEQHLIKTENLLPNSCGRNGKIRISPLEEMEEEDDADVIQNDDDHDHDDSHKLLSSQRSLVRNSNYSRKSFKMLSKATSTRRVSNLSSLESLNPSSHQFQSNLRSPMRRELSSRLEKLRSFKKSKKGRSVTNMHLLAATTPSIQSFLDEKVQLQKDSQKNHNQDHQSNVMSAIGREETIHKLKEKMNVVVDAVNQYGATLTRIPARVITTRGQKQIVETRSMLAIQKGFVSMKYGILVHWNVQTGLVEFILLRKSCRESFMKTGLSPSLSTKKMGKSWRKKKKKNKKKGI